MRTQIILLSLISLIWTSQSQAQVTADFNTSDTIVCDGQSIIFTYTGQGANLFVWNFGDGDVSQSTTDPQRTKTFYSPGTYLVKLLATDGTTSDSVSRLIRVKPRLSTSFSLNESSNDGYYCVGTNLSISQWSNIVGFDSIFWDFGDGYLSNLRFPNHTYSTPGQYEIKLTLKGFCGVDENSMTVDIVSDQRGKPQGNLSVFPNSVCPSEQFNINIWPGTVVPDSIRVYLGDGNTTMLDQFDYMYEKEGMYTIQAMSYNTCGGDTFEQVVNVSNSQKRTGNIYLNGEELCIGQSLRGSLGARGLVKATLNYDDGTTETFTDDLSFEHQFASNGTYNVTAIFEFLCGELDTAVRTVKIGSGSQVFNFSINPYRNKYCLGEMVQFNPPWLYRGDTLAIDFGDGSTARFYDTIGVVAHMYTKTGNYFVKAVKSNACGFSKLAQANVTVQSDAMPYLTISADYSGEETPTCNGDTILLRMNAEGFTLTNPKFSFEDGSSQNGEMVNMPFNKGQHLIKATAENLCGIPLTSYFTLDVWDHTLNPSLSYYFYPFTQCVNQEFFFDVFANRAKSVLWDMGDGTTFYGDLTQPHVMYTYDEPGMYTVNIEAKNGCGTTKTSSILNVASGPSLSFTNTDLNINIGDSVTFTQTSTSGGKTYWVFNLDLNDTSSATVVTRKYPQRGVYTVSLFGINDFGCWDTIHKTVKVGFVDVKDVVGNETGITVYPNPANNYLNVLVPSESGDFSISLIDVQGRVQPIIQSRTGINAYRIDLKEVKSGIYFIRLLQDDKYDFAKVIVTK